MRDTIYPPHNFSAIFMETGARRRREPRLTIFGAKDEMVMQEKSVEGIRQVLALLPERNPALRERVRRFLRLPPDSPAG